jgi:hypothetical protein
MERLRNSLVLLLVAGIPAAAPPLDPVSPDLCFAAGPVTYRLARTATLPDYRVRIDDSAADPDLRIALVDRAETADFALVDDAAPAVSTCRDAGGARTVAIVPAGKPADVTIGLTSDPATANFSLYVYSARVSHRDAAALFALMRHVDLTEHVDLVR